MLLKKKNLPLIKAIAKISPMLTLTDGEQGTMFMANDENLSIVSMLTIKNGDDFINDTFAVDSNVLVNALKRLNDATLIVHENKIVLKEKKRKLSIKKRAIEQEQMFNIKQLKTIFKKLDDIGTFGGDTLKIIFDDILMHSKISKVQPLVHIKSIHDKNHKISFIFDGVDSEYECVLPSNSPTTTNKNECNASFNVDMLKNFAIKGVKYHLKTNNDMPLLMTHEDEDIVLQILAAPTVESGDDNEFDVSINEDDENG